METLEREQLLNIVNTLLDNNCYELSFKYITRIIEISPKLNEIERNLFMLPYRHVVEQMRKALLDTICTINSDETDSDAQILAYKFLKNDLTDRILDIANEVIMIISDKLLPEAEDPSAQIFYAIQIGDMCRYISELEIDDSDEASQTSKDNYELARDLAAKHLPATHPDTLKAAINYSVLLHDVLLRKDEAIAVSQDAYNLASKALETVCETKKEELEEILRCMQDNFILWTSSP